MARSRLPSGGARGGVIFEFWPRGAYVKVSAVDEATGTEVSIVGDARVTQADLQRIALRKLEKALAADQPKKRR
ncbi:serine hydroxymethyltransferase [Pyruvatibacter sp.]|uniref:DUF6898 family protein n=1 Tax=Pyruvatibacter sp. TaxID=1981328 RepID=UPI0032EE5748